MSKNLSQIVHDHFAEWTIAYSCVAKKLTH